MKKKILAISLAIALIAIAVVGGSLAWFSDTDAATNVFTIGSVEIVQHEQQRSGEGDELVPFENDKVLMPIVKTDDPSADANYLDKIVSVESTGKNPAYVRTHIAVPTVLVPILTLDYSDSANWVLTQTTAGVEVDDIEYTVYSYTYRVALGKDAVTDVLLEGVYLNANVDVKEQTVAAEGGAETTVKKFCTPNEDGTYTFYDFELDDDTKINILVATQGCQSEGFEDAQSALDAVFPELPAFTVS